jgi:dTDP-4-amino-4,6-dideoxygalactose transaminase
MPANRLRAGISGMSLPCTEAAAGETLSLPVHPGMSERELERVAAACNSLGGRL